MVVQGGVEFSDGTIALRPLVAEDAADHLAGEDPELVRWLNGGPGTPETVGKYIARAEQMWVAGGPVFTFAIHSVVDDVLVGTIDVQLDQDYTDADTANLAYGIYPAWRGRGWATRAVRLALHFLKNHTDATHVLIRTDPDNIPSAAVARQTGFALRVEACNTPDGRDWYQRSVR